MVKIVNIFGDQYSGQAGKAGVFAKWKGRQYRRSYVIPANPKSTMQQWIRNAFSSAVAKWHQYHPLQRLVFSYLATGLVMSGFNLLVKRWQTATAESATLPLDPLEGIKQIASASDEAVDEVTGSTANPCTLSNSPISIGSLKAGTTWNSAEQVALIDIEMGDVRIPNAILGTAGETSSPSTALASGDKLVISYTSGGRTITREELATATEIGGDTDYEFKAQTLRTAYYPVDFKSVVVEIYDASEETYTQIESEEVDNINHQVYLDKSTNFDAGDTHTYTYYTPIEDAKLEVTKVDTSFITWRAYSDKNGHIPIAQTIEDQTYDWSLSAGGYVSVIRSAQSAELATKHELVVMTATS